MKGRTLRSTLGWLLVSLIVPLALGTLAVLVLESQRSAAAERERLASLAGTLLRAVDAQLARSRTQLEVLARSPALARGDLAQLHDFAKAVTGGSPGSVVTLVDARGHALLSTAVAWGDPLPNYRAIAESNQVVPWNGGSLRLGAENVSRRAIEENKVTYSDLFFGVKAQRPALALAQPATCKGGEPCALVMVFAPSMLQEMVAGSVSSRGVRVLVTDRRGTVISRNTETPVQVGRRARYIPEMVQGDMGSFRLKSVDGKVLEGAFAVSPATGYVVRVAQAAPSPPLPGWATTWLVILLLVSAVAFGLIVWFASQLARPIRLLANDLSQGRMPSGDFRSDIAEFRLLAGAVSAAVEAERFRRTEEERKIRELQDRALFAEQMVGIVSHDLRNPLVAAQLSAMALGQAPIPPEQQMLVHQVREALRRAHALVHELLDFTRARIGTGLPVNLAPVELHQLIATHLRTLRSTYPGHRLLHECTGEGACEADADRLLQLTDNLVNNAVTYGDRDHPIVIRTSIEEGQFCITVHNRGNPIPGPVLDQVFKPMVRTEAFAQRAGGVGLGLYIVAEIARAHAGEASVTSSTDAGTAVTASFPR